MNSKETLRRRDLDSDATVERARKRIAAVAKAENFDFMREDKAVAQGWIGALHVEGLLSKEQYEVLDAELDKAADEWEQPV
ncbi:hypothetical protein [Pseudomonas fluorescens]|uniref:Uncharacterized protein n=1 Tax=Pseudomonas fluorescens TaxID=294 RepID=A0A2T0HN63_PSEFL|nr:hypothetical protein [Pseudomonas fluorescens]PRW84457.1 hypothetical protein C7A10_28905 [Pseudomonas fluorescens]